MKTENNSDNIKNLFGLSDKEYSAYIALLTNGPMLPLHIAKMAGVKRTTFYEFLPKLIASNLLQEVAIGNRRGYAATSPEILLRDYRQQHKEILASMEGLIDLYRFQGLRPHVEQFEGLEGVKRIYEATLNEKSLYVVQRTDKNRELLDWIVTHFTPERAKKRIPLKAITEEGGASEKYFFVDKSLLRDIRYVPTDKFPFEMEMMIFGNKLSLNTTGKNGPLVGIVITSKQIVRTMLSLFELAWMGAKDFQK